jgi:hypothetical protein
MGLWPALVGVGVMVLTTPLNTLLTRYQSRAGERVMAAKDARVKAVAEALQV